MASVAGVGGDLACAADDYWHELIRLRNARGLVCGTSDSPAGRALEASARRAAVVAGVPIAVIEDFPGNYYEVPSGSADFLVVESAAVAALTRRKFGGSCPQIKALSLARYDPHRRAAPSRRSIRRDKDIGQKGQVSVLWAGQPETPDCLVTLSILLPLLAARGIELLFKAHPRDAGYSSGAYRALLANAGIVSHDVTHLSVEEALLLAPRLVITQFSSAAIEAGFFGIPSLNIVLPDAGGARLLEKKGYQAPLHCAEGAAGCVMRSDELAGVLYPLIDDKTARENLIRCFDAYFCTAELMLPHLSAMIENLFQNKGFPP
ncbi:MAG: hypothetical protein ABL891_01265 [Burkholderiales bacterium]